MKKFKVIFNRVQIGPIDITFECETFEGCFFQAVKLCAIRQYERILEIKEVE